MNKLIWVRHPVKPPKFHRFDVRDNLAWSKIFEENTPVWGVIHLAALKSIGESIEIPLKYYDVNVGGSVALLNVSSLVSLIDID